MSASRLAVRTAAAMSVATIVGPAALANDNTTPTYIGMTTEDVGVMDRARPGYDAKGIPLGAFRLFPTVGASASYDDNVFKTATAKSDWFFTISPNARLNSNWGRHFFEIYSGLNYYNYSTYTDENLTDWNIGADGRIDISRAANFTANVFYGQMHELWSAPNNTGFQAAPNRYWQTHVEASAIYQPNRLGFGLGGVYDKYNFTRTPRLGGGFLYNDDRDQNENQAYFKVYYDFSPGYSGFLKASYDERDFDLYHDRSGLHRGSHGFRLDGGVNLQISHLVRGEIYIGYLQQNFADPALKDVSGFDYGVQLDWFVSPVFTAHITGKRTLDNVILNGVSVADNKSIGISGDYELLPNVIVQGRASYTDSRYIGTSRTDTYPSAGIGIKYLVSRYVTLDANYNYSRRSTDQTALEYSDNTLNFGLTLHL